MCKLSLSMSRGAKSTVISNYFIDELMPEANGSYVKVYIYLLRLMSDSSELSLSLIADRLEETEKDIRRALKYWEDHGLLTVKYNSAGEVTDIVLLNPELDTLKPQASREKQQTFEQDAVPGASKRDDAKELTTKDDASPEELQSFESSGTTVTNRPTYSPRQIALALDSPEMKALVRRIASRTGRPVSQGDTQLIMFFYEAFEFSPDLIFYLYDYCSEKGKVSTSYIEKVGLNWVQDGIRTVEAANQQMTRYTDQIRTVCKAFGLNRQPADIEKTYIRRWFSDYGFSLEMVKEACDRTVSSISQPSFKYADKILTTWNQLGIRTLADLNANESERQKGNGRSAKKASTPAEAKPNKFTSFQQRSYSPEDFADLEMKLMNS